jgi:hypothetical protein
VTLAEWEVKKRWWRLKERWYWMKESWKSVGRLKLRSVVYKLFLLVGGWG